LGRVRQKMIKNTAAKLLRLHSDLFTTDFKHNRDAIKDLIDVEGTVMRNRIAGYLTRLKRRESSN
jgi:small subunit ribosomal protein S17e